MFPVQVFVRILLQFLLKVERSFVPLLSKQIQARAPDARHSGRRRAKRLGTSFEARLRYEVFCR
jgi:hypothetical protein